MDIFAGARPLLKGQIKSNHYRQVTTETCGHYTPMATKTGD